MDRNTILAIARQEGIQQPENHAGWLDVCLAAVAAERVECAKVCDEKLKDALEYHPGAKACSLAIRMRSNIEAQARPEAGESPL